MYRKFANKNKFNKKRLSLVIILLLLAVVGTLQIDFFAIAGDNADIESMLSDSVFDILNNLNLSDIDLLISEINSLYFFDSGIKEKLREILSGNYFTDYSSLIGSIFSLIFIDIKKVLPFLFTIIAIGLLSNMVISFRSDNKNTSDTISFVFFSILIITILFAFKNILSITSNTFNSIVNQMQIIFPILITLLSSIGSLSSISIYNPLVAILTTIVSIVFDKFLYPIFIAIFLFTILGYIGKGVKLDKIINFLNSIFKWSIGIVFTLFTGFLTIQGISAGKFDSVSIKATKFAMKSYIPIIGSYISEGMDFFVLGSVLIKNSIGLVGVIILFLTIISPIISILIYKFALQLSGGILEMSGCNKISDFLNSSSNSKFYFTKIIVLINIYFIFNYVLITFK